ncbi:hypothetical protein [Paenibacillus sp. S02]|uniref:hypothetical protein n=1 Tax=Paenibacillus sp. S02 TaxID=2823904 RepID=UPI001C6483BA|nr:hypothetical protein [Paenibacillus sp. S02]
MSTSIIITAMGYIHEGSIPSREKEWVGVSVVRIRQQFHAECEVRCGGQFPTVLVQIRASANME